MLNTKLIPVEIEKCEQSNKQEEEWNEFWKNRLWQGIINFTRFFEVHLFLATFLRDHRKAKTLFWPHFLPIHLAVPIGILFKG